MKSVWSAHGKIIMEREFWIAVMRAQKDLGVKIEKASIDRSEKVKALVDLESIRKREVVTKHGGQGQARGICRESGPPTCPQRYDRS